MRLLTVRTVRPSPIHHPKLMCKALVLIFFDYYLGFSLEMRTRDYVTHHGFSAAVSQSGTYAQKSFTAAADTRKRHTLEFLLVMHSSFT
jgi:hypothetical protein